MAKKNKFYVTTPIYYANSTPHVGSAYTTIAADILSRWNRLQGKEVFFLTGTDEHGQKIQQVAHDVGLKPKEFVDDMAKKFIETFKQLNISNDNFIRTTDENHIKEVKRILQELYDKKFIYKGIYESYYCVGCEQYKTKKELLDGKCLIHKKEVQILKEESYIFKLSSFSDKILKLVKTDKYRILPQKRKNEVVSFIEEGLADISISRLKSKVAWGIELPFDKEHTCYVWVDAFWSYITGIGSKKNFDKFWPSDLQLMANDILRVHATIWPALLLALDYELPKKLFVHGYFTVDGEKMSKSSGNAVSPLYLIDKYSADTLRYYLLRKIVFGEDGDFSEEGLKEAHNNELANKLGNLVSRVSTLAEKCGLAEKKLDTLFSKDIQAKVKKHIDELHLDKALHEIFSFVDQTNEFVQEKKPWETHDSEILYEISNAIKDIAILLYPFMPQTCENIAKTFNFEISLDALKSPLKLSKIKKSEILFKKV